VEETLSEKTPRESEILRIRAKGVHSALFGLYGVLGGIVPGVCALSAGDLTFGAAGVFGGCALTVLETTLAVKHLSEYRRLSREFNQHFPLKELYKESDLVPNQFVSLKRHQL